MINHINVLLVAIRIILKNFKKFSVSRKTVIKFLILSNFERRKPASRLIYAQSKLFTKAYLCLEKFTHVLVFGVF